MSAVPVARPEHPARPGQQPFTPRSWEALNREEQRRQIRELIASPYWTILPQDIKERFLDLYRAC